MNKQRSIQFMAWLTIVIIVAAAVCAFSEPLVPEGASIDLGAVRYSARQVQDDL